MENAPFFADVAHGPDDGAAWWLTTEDGLRVRVGAWARDAKKGTVLLFPGRTEYVEKYGRAAQDFALRGYSTLAVDWRGQGLADRLLDDTMSGHVLKFTDYQHDVAAAVAAAQALNLPRPWHLLGHSMGGCIGLRAIMEGLPVQSCVFSGPMWGIRMASSLRPLAWSLSWSGRQLGMGHVYAPGTSQDNYVLSEPFETNKLTCDRSMYDYMIDQARAYPQLGLGGPSLHWLHEALKETRLLARRPSPDMPCLTILGTDEDIVDVNRIHDRMERWPQGDLELINGGRHEVLMDSAAIRTQVFTRICDHYNRSAGVAPAMNPERPIAAAGPIL